MSRRNPINTDEGVARLTVVIPAPEADFAERLASYRNTVARIRGKNLGKQWTRKMMAEDALIAGIEAKREEVKAMIEACGDIPPAKDERAMEQYARRVLAWDKKHFPED